MNATTDPVEPSAQTRQRVAKRWWVPALVLNIVSGLIGVLWAVMLVFMGGLAEFASLFGHGGGERLRFEIAAKGASWIVTGVVVAVAPLFVGTTAAALRRPNSVMVSYAIGLSMLVLPWGCLLGSSSF